MKKHQMLFFIHFLLVVCCGKIYATTCAEPEFNQTEVNRFLTVIANAEPEAWPAVVDGLKKDFPKFMQKFDRPCAKLPKQKNTENR